MATNGTLNTATKSLLSPTELCHIVLKTTPENRPAMVQFYLTFLGARIVHQNHRITFMTYDDKDHRLAIVAVPGLTPDATKSVGLAHICFGFDTLSDLATSYEQKKAHGIHPTWCVNHGMTMSMYFADIDGNGVETQVDNFDTAEECMRFIESEAFARNPIGVDYDPEEFVRRVREGGDLGVLRKRVDIGERFTREENNGKVLAVA